MESFTLSHGPCWYFYCFVGFQILVLGIVLVERGTDAKRQFSLENLFLSSDEMDPNLTNVTCSIFSIVVDGLMQIYVCVCVCIIFLFCSCVTVFLGRPKMEESIGYSIPCSILFQL
jgi:hypothetical protein